MAPGPATRVGQACLWPHSISDDLLIVLVRVAGVDDETVVRQLLHWRIYARHRGLKLDLVILDERGGEPSDQLRKELETGVAREMLGKADGVFFLNADKVPTDEGVLLAAAARAVLGGNRGSLTEQIDHRATPRIVPAPPFTQTAIATKPVTQP